MEWAVPNRIAALEGVAAAAFAIAAVVTLLTGDRAAAAVAGVAAALLAVLAIRDRVARVRLSADPDGVTLMHGFVQRRRIPWSDIAAVRVESRSHRAGRLLEIDTGETIYLLSGREMGAEPSDVVEALDQIRP